MVKSELIQVRVTPEQAEKLNRLSKLTGQNTSRVLRGLIDYIEIRDPVFCAPSTSKKRDHGKL